MLTQAINHNPRYYNVNAAAAAAADDDDDGGVDVYDIAMTTTWRYLW